MDTNRVLLVDDDIAWRILLSLVLQRLGYEPAAVPSVEQALPRLPAADLVVTDLWMPERTGLDLLRELRARGLAIPAIVLTASDDERLRRRALELGAAAVLDKGVDAEALGAALSAARVAHLHAA